MENEFTHTLQQGLEAKENLIKHTGLKEGDFYPADKDYEELGIPEGSPMVISHDDDSKSAYDLWEEWKFEEAHGDDYADWCIKMDLYK